MSGDTTQVTLNRRQMLQGACGVMALSVLNMPAWAAVAANTLGLRDIAAVHKKIFGIAVGSDWLIDEVDYANAITKEANLLVPEYEMKWYFLHPQEKVYNFTGFDRITKFAAARNMKVRGHPLIWHDAMPAWALAKLTVGDKKAVEAMMTDHITTVMRRNLDVKDWDVVNEAIDNDSKRTDGLRESLWLKALGPDYIVKAFTIARSVNPSARLVYNDFGLEGTNIWYDSLRRKAVLNLLTNLKKQGVPVHALGLQSHLRADLPLSTTEFVTFLKAVRALGIDIIVTELDVRTDKLPANADKAKLAAAYVGNYLDLIRSTGPLDTVITWGISDRHSWVVSQFGAGAAAPLPFDKKMQRLEMWNTLNTRWAAL